MRTFDQLSLELQLVLKERFQRYDMDAAYMFDESGIFAPEVKSLSDLEILNFIDKKDISHIYPQSSYPELSNDPTNVFLEDFAENRARGDEIVTPDEIFMAYQDQIQDTFDLDVNDDGVVDLISDQFSNNDYSAIGWSDFDFTDFF